MAKLMLVLPDLDYGGAQRVMLSLSAQFVRQGHEVEFIVIRGGGPLESELPSGTLLTTILKKSTRVYLLPILSLIHLCKFIRNRDVDAILSSVTGANLVTIAGARLAKSRSKVVVRHENSGQDVKSLFRKYLIRFLYPLADKVITVSNEAGYDLGEIMPSQSEKILVIRNPVDYQLIKARSLESIGSRWIDEKAVPFILAVGRLEEQKDFVTLIRAFNKLAKKLPVSLVILGEGKQRSNLESLIHTLGVGDKVHMPGTVSNPYSWMCRCSAFVMSSKWEGHPVALIEAMLLGANVVATDCRSGPREVLCDGRYGSLVPVGGVDAMSDAIESALHSRSSVGVSRDLGSEFSPAKAAALHLSCLLDR